MKGHLPKQRLSFTAKNKQWRIDNVDFNCAEADQQYEGRWKNMHENYQLMNNILDQEEFQKFCDPLGLDIGTGKDYVHAFNKLYNKINVMLGEELKRPWSYHVISKGTANTNEVLRQRDRDLRKYLTRAFTTEVQTEMAKAQLEARMQTEGIPLKQAERQMQAILEEAEASLKEVMDPLQINAKYKRYKTSVEKKMAVLLRDSVIRHKLRHLKNEAFYHAQVAGLEAVMVTMVHNNLHVEVLNPLGIAYHKSPEQEFLQEGERVTYKREMSLSEVMDRYSEYLTKKDFDKLNNYSGNVYGLDAQWASKSGFSPSHFEHIQYRKRLEGYYGTEAVLQEGGYGQSSIADDYLTVYTTFWRSQRKVGFLTYEDERGNQQTMRVDEQYPIPKNRSFNKYKDEVTGDDITKIEWTDQEGHFYSLEWIWIPEIWEGHRIEGDIYPIMRPYPYAFYSETNPFKTPLPIFGCPYNAKNARIQSSVDRAKPWQKLYFFVMMKWIKLLAQDEGTLTMINTLMLDQKMGWKNTMQYLFDTGKLPYNPLSHEEGAGLMHHMKVAEKLDLSNVAQLQHYANILQFIEAQIAEAIGVPPEREGRTSPNTNVTDNQQDIIQSSHITEPTFALHDLLWETILNEVVRMREREFTDGNQHVHRYILDDDEIATLTIQPNEFESMDMGVVIANNTKANEILNYAKQQAHALIQNDKLTLDGFMEMLTKEDVAEMRDYIREMEQDISQREQRMQEQQQQHMEQLKQMEIEAREDEQAHEVEIEHIKGDYKLKEAEIRSFSFQMDQDINDNNIPDQLELERLRQNDRKLDLQAKKQQDDKALKQEQLRIQRETKNKPTR